MTMRKALLFLVMLSLMFPAVATAKKKKKARAAPAPAVVEDDPAALRADVLRFLQVSGGLDGADVMLVGMVDQFRQLDLNVPDPLWDQFLAEVDLEEFANLIAPIYEKHFTHAEILDAIAFYEGPTGSKFARLAPVLTKEGMAVGEVWGRAIGERAMKIIRTEAEGE
jgi:hypothetical protein